MVIDDVPAPTAKGVKFRMALLTGPLMPVRSNFRYASHSLLVKWLALFWTSRSAAFP